MYYYCSSSHSWCMLAVALNFALHLKHVWGVTGRVLGVSGCVWTRVEHRLQFPNRLELVLKSVPNRFEESSFERHANICIYAHNPPKSPKLLRKVFRARLG